MKSSKLTTKSTIIISLAALLFVIVLLTLHTTKTFKTTKLSFTEHLIPYTQLYDNTLSQHIPPMIKEFDSTTQETDYLIEDGKPVDPFIQNPIVIPEVLELDEDLIP